MPLDIVRCYHELYRLFSRCHDVGKILDASVTEMNVRVVLDRSFVLTYGCDVHELEFDKSNDPVLKSVEVLSSEEEGIVMKLYLCRQFMTSTVFEALKKAESSNVMEVLNNLLLVFVPSMLLCRRRKVAYDTERLLSSVRSYASVWGFNPKELVFAYEHLQFSNRAEGERRRRRKHRPSSTSSCPYMGISMKSQMLKFRKSN